ncbi:MAG: DUF2760 domain-containing protein [Chlamydiota bacterium]|nr:DUF2760 domain-containing protein [Chlamydiota bacterium]
MRLVNAFKAFWKVLKNPECSDKLLEVQPPKQEKQDPSHLQLLSLLQQSGRLVDFLKEDISSFNDAQVGAAVRKIHHDCNKSLEDLVTIRPVMEEKEGQMIDIPKGFDPSTIKIVGKIKGEPPFSGKLVHKGWKAHKRSLPKQVGELTTEIIHPAEVEIR